MVSFHPQSRTLRRPSPAFAALAALAMVACGRSPAPSEPVPAEVAMTPEAVAEVEQVAPVVASADAAGAADDNVSPTLAAEAEPDAPAVHGIRITDDGIIGPGFMITGDGIIAPGVEITKKHLKIVITGDGPELEGLRDRLEALGPRIRDAVKGHIHADGGGHLRIGAVALGLHEDGGLRIDIDDNGSDFDVHVNVDLDDVAEEVAALDGAKLAKLVALARALGGDDEGGEPGHAEGGERFSCAAGECEVECPKGKPCRASCAGGGCRQTCHEGATCRLTCAGGDCNQRCEAGASCKLSCAGGGCRRECAETAKCEMSCLGDDCATVTPR